MRNLLIAISLFSLVALTVGCANRVSFIDKGKEESAHRWRVEKLKSSKLSADQQAVLSEKGAPDYIKFYLPMRKREGGLLVRAGGYIGGGFKSVFINSMRPVNSYRSIEAWIYDREGILIWFKDGKRVDYVAVEE